jgi:hypothetical protein
MGPNLERRRPDARRSLLAVSALLFGMLLGPTIPVAATPGAEAGRLHSALARIAKLANREVKPPALQLARDLPAAADRIERLREPALTGQTQIRIALDELRQVGAIATLDPHYLPALVAAGRAYVAVSGQDPLTATTINPDYRGLEPELADEAAQLGSSATEAATLSSRVKRLTRSLAGAKRRARQLERRIQRMRAPDAPPTRR